MSGFYNQLFNERNESYSVIIEDDGRVAYAYLLHEKIIIGDVWLYNHAETPLETDWTDVTGVPFLNAHEFVQTNIAPILNIDQIKLEWSEDTELGGVLVYVRDQLTAKLACNSKPGWSMNVIKDGPLARLFRL